MSESWNMYNIWPRFYWSWGSRPTIGSFVYLTHIVGYCLVSYWMYGPWLSKGQPTVPPFSHEVVIVCSWHTIFSQDGNITGTWYVCVQHLSKYWYYKKVHHKSRWNFADGYFSKPNSNLQTHELVLDNRLHSWQE